MKKRVIGLDIIRVLSMLGIIGLHVINQGGLIGNANNHSIKYYLIVFLLVLFFTSVDVFALLSGYLNIDKEKNKHSRIVEIISITIYYSILIPSIFYIFNLYEIRGSGFKSVLYNYISILDGRNWYVTCYTLLFMLIPFINKFCKELDREHFKKLLILLFILLTIIPNILQTDIFKLFSGYSPFWLIYCYMIGAYIKLYDIKLNNKKALIYIIITLLITYILNLIIRYNPFLLFGRDVTEQYLINYVSPFILFISICMILLFKNIKVSNKLFNKIIIYFSKASFSVYIIHCNKLIFDYIFKDLFVFLLEYNSIIVFIFVILSMIGIYIVCTIIDEHRKLIYKLFRINKLNDYLGNKIDNIMN